MLFFSVTAVQIQAKLLDIVCNFGEKSITITEIPKFLNGLFLLAHPVQK